MLLIISLSIPFFLYIFIPIKKNYRYFSAFFIVTFYFLLFLPSLHQNRLLSKNGIHHVGILKNKICDIKNEQFIEYIFIINGNKISGSGRPGAGNNNCESLKIGDQIFITYLPENETINVPERDVHDNTFIYAAAFFLLYIILLLVGNAQEKFRNNK